MLRLNDLLLMLVVAVSIPAGLFLPVLGVHFQPYLKYFMMFLLFLSFLSIKLTAIGLVIRFDWLRIVTLSTVKIVILPIAVFFLFHLFCPSFAVAALLLSGISTGVVAPFIANVVEGNTALVLAVVVVTSVVTPFSLPALVDFLAGESFTLSLTAMISLLAQVIFIPMAAGEALRRLAPGFVEGLLKRSFPISLVFFGIINLAIFSKYGDFFRQEPMIIVKAVIVAVILGLVYVLTGLVMFKGAPPSDQMAGAVSLGHMNNVLVIVFASQFFGPIEPTLAAMYMFPFFGLIVPLRLYRHRLEARIPTKA